VARGRTVNVSSGGAYVLAECVREVPHSKEVIVELTVPQFSYPPQKDTHQTRKVRYACRIVRRERARRLTGLALQFVQKLAG